MKETVSIICDPNRLLPPTTNQEPKAQVGLVLFLDIMGFKEKVLRTPHMELEKELRAFKSKHTKLKPLMQRGSIELIQFSDSIIAVAHKADMFTLNRMVKIASILMHIGLESHFAMKGAIAMGEVTFDAENQLFFGQAIVDAYLMEEELKMYGVVFHHSVEALVKRSIAKSAYPTGMGRQIYYPIQKCRIPLKTCVCEHYCVVWHKISRQLDEGDITDDVKEWLEDINLTVSGAPRIYVDNTLAVINETNKSKITTSSLNRQKSTPRRKKHKARKDRNQH